MITCKNGLVKLEGRGTEVIADAVFIFESLNKAGILEDALDLYKKIPDWMLDAANSIEHKWEVMDDDT